MSPLSLAAIFATSLLVGFSGALVPGPLLAVTVSESARRGFWAGPLLMLGHSLLELAIVLALAVGLSQALRSTAVTSAVGLAGGVVLVTLGLLMARSAWKGATLTVKGRGGPAALRLMVLTGVVGSLANPYFVLWWASVGANYVVLSLAAGAVGLAAFYLGHILSDFIWYSGVSWAVASGRRLLGGWLYRGLLLACSLFLIALGSYFAVRSLHALS